MTPRKLHQILFVADCYIQYNVCKCFRSGYIRAYYISCSLDQMDDARSSSIIISIEYSIKDMKLYAVQCIQCAQAEKIIKKVMG